MTEELRLHSETSHWPHFTRDRCIMSFCFLMEVHISVGATAESPLVFLSVLQRKELSLFCLISPTQSVNLCCRQHCGSSSSDLSLQLLRLLLSDE